MTANQPLVWVPPNQGRSIRPRPINPEERLPVVFLGTRKDGHGEPLEAALVEFLRAQEAEAEVLAQEQKQQAAAAAASQVIHVPQVRQVADYETTNLAALRDVPRYSALDPSTASYFRYNDMWVRQTVAQVVTDYDMDSDDEQCMAKIQAKAATRTARSGQQACPQLSADLFESLIEKLENMHFEALKQRSNVWQQDIKNGRVPRIPATEAVLSRSAAVKGMMGEAETWVLEAMYDHWRAKRKAVGWPLLQHLGFEMPWKAVSFADPSEPEEMGDMPFMVSETANSRGGRGLRATDQDAWEILAGVRGELEALRTLADQVRKRERLKKLLLKGWKEQLKSGKLPTERKIASAAPPNKFLARHTSNKSSRGTGKPKGQVSLASTLLAGPSAQPARKRGRPPKATPAGASTTAASGAAKRQRVSSPDSPDRDVSSPKHRQPQAASRGRPPAAPVLPLVPPEHVTRAQAARLATLTPDEYTAPVRRRTWKELEDEQEGTRAVHRFSKSPTPARTAMAPPATTTRPAHKGARASEEPTPPPKQGARAMGIRPQATANHNEQPAPRQTAAQPGRRTETAAAAAAADEGPASTKVAVKQEVEADATEQAAKDARRKGAGPGKRTRDESAPEATKPPTGKKLRPGAAAADEAPAGKKEASKKAAASDAAGKGKAKEARDAGPSKKAAASDAARKGKGKEAWDEGPSSEPKVGHKDGPGGAARGGAKRPPVETPAAAASRSLRTRASVGPSDTTAAAAGPAETTSQENQKVAAAPAAAEAPAPSQGPAGRRSAPLAPLNGVRPVAQRAPDVKPALPAAKSIWQRIAHNLGFNQAEAMQLQDDTSLQMLVPVAARKRTRAEVEDGADMAPVAAKTRAAAANRSAEASCGRSSRSVPASNTVASGPNNGKASAANSVRDAGKATVAGPSSKAAAAGEDTGKAAVGGQGAKATAREGSKAATQGEGSKAATPSGGSKPVEGDTSKAEVRTLARQAVQRALRKGTPTLRNSTPATSPRRKR